VKKIKNNAISNSLQTSIASSASLMASSPKYRAGHRFPINLPESVTASCGLSDQVVVIA
jgi:hypothetical protein